MKHLSAFFLLLPLATAGMASPGAHGPNGEHLDAAATTSVIGLRRLPDGSLHVPVRSQRLMQIRTLLAPLGQGQLAIELPGQAVANPNFSGVVQSGQSGRLEAGKAGLPLLGQRVTKGEILGWIRYTPDSYAAATHKARLAELESELIIARQRAARLADLSGSVPRKEIDAAQATLSGLEGQYRSLRQGASDREALRAPVSGVISTASAQAGQVIAAGQTLFTIVAPEQMLIEARTREPGLAGRISQASIVSAPEARLRLIGAGGVLVNGLLPLSFRVDRGHGLVIGEAVTVIATLHEKRAGIILPADAIVKGGANETLVWIKAGAERFLPQPVTLQRLDARTVLITDGLGADNRVVVQGASLLSQVR